MFSLVLRGVFPVPGGWIALLLLAACSILLLASLLAFVLAHDGARNTALARSFPDAYLVNLVNGRYAGPAMRKLQVAFDAPTTASGLFRSYNRTLVADARTVQFYRGGRTPRLLLSVPASSLTGIGTNSRLTPAGTPAPEVAVLEFQSPNGRVRQVFTFASVGLRQRVLHDQQLADALRSLSLAVGHTVPLND